ncbi:MAG TPA: glycosyltransferase family 2 protein [Vicinamibacterales bacterium]|nr:glycosyltransferase family 2 protein [Vicinamibacterales bacterium]
MIETPTVSVLLTVYNRERYVGASIESVLAQTCRDFELIVCDDHSTDGTRAIVDRYARDDRRIRICVNERNLGQFRNRGHAASLARGRYLKYHDSDDLMYPHCLETMLRALEAEPRAAFALSGSQYWPGGPCPMLLTPKLAYEREFLGSGLFHLGPAAALFRTDVFRELGGFPLNGIASDYLFWIEACAKVSVLLVSADLFYYRIHNGQELSDPSAGAEYAKAARAAWEKLHSPDCPLDAAGREQAKRNFAYVQARGVFRRLLSGNFASAAAILRFAGLDLAAWLRYLRPPRRTSFAGTPIATA